jgi:hypothetical protein
LGLLLSYYKHTTNLHIGAKSKQIVSTGFNYYGLGALLVFIAGFLDLLSGFYGWLPILNNASNNNSTYLFYLLSIIFVICNFYAFYSRGKSKLASVIMAASITLLAFVIVVVSSFAIAFSQI